MQVTATNFTIAEYCSQMKEGKIIINRDYQRSDKVWPPAARSYLIDTILYGYPIPKLSLYQKTDLKSRTTIKEIVDGQQRSQAILDFFEGKLRITTGKSDFTGKRYCELEDESQQQFVDYALTTDVFAGANDEDIRQVFRRMNSYTVPLNAPEKRHATFQGDFKWFIVGLVEKYAQVLKDMGVFSERQLSRMADAALLTEITVAMLEGIKTASQARLEKAYREYNTSFPNAKDISRRLDAALTQVVKWVQLHRGPLMKPHNIFCLVLAITHSVAPLGPLQELCRSSGQGVKDPEIALTNLSVLADAIEDPPAKGDWKGFVEAGAAGTNTEKNRTIRFKFFCDALRPKRLP